MCGCKCKSCHAVTGCAVSSQLDGHEKCPTPNVMEHRNSIKNVQVSSDCKKCNKQDARMIMRINGTTYGVLICLECENSLEWEEWKEMELRAPSAKE